MSPTRPGTFMIWVWSVRVQWKEIPGSHSTKGSRARSSSETGPTSAKAGDNNSKSLGCGIVQGSVKVGAVCTLVIHVPAELQSIIKCLHKRCKEIFGMQHTEFFSFGLSLLKV